MSISGKFHDKFVYDRRMSQLHDHISKLISEFGCERILDVGAGDGKIDSMLMETNNIPITGIDVLVRDVTYIPVEEYDGSHINREDNSVNTTMMIDVLHHIDDPEAVFKEVVRVTDKYVIIKDHIRHGFISYIKLKMMDYVGNKQYSVRLPYNYLTAERWNKMFKDNNLEVVSYNTDLKLYKGLFHLLFDSNLHFITILKKS
ncbi:MAG: class I SAM-dependent methyltransferase [Ruminococcaceae bacterium]|nr:class I SAM-dependent methyltransferase [Oscillospiraceae bacterium]